MKMLLRFVGTAAAVLLAAYLVPGFHVADFYTAAILALLLGVIGITIKPIIKLLTLPINFLTLGLFSLVINAAILLFLASFVQGFTIDSFVAALIGGVVIAVATWVLHIFV